MKYSTIIFESNHFVVAIPEPPHIDRADGGHIVIVSKEAFSVFSEMPYDQACEMIKLAQQLGRALQTVLSESGIDIGIVNYQINGNWSAKQEKKDPLHMHIYGRAIHSKYQIYGEALRLPNLSEGEYNQFSTLTDADIAKIRSMLQK